MIEDAERACDSVAVLIPAYNGQADLERTLASFRETAPLDVLIVDDGSEPPLVAPHLPGLRVQILRLDRNGGIERALAAGIEALAERGFRYAARIDAGDLALPDRIGKQRAYLDAHPEVAALGMWAEAVTRAGEPLFTLRPPAEPASIRRLRFFRSCFVHPAMMLRIEAVREAGNYRASYPAAEDLDLFLRLMERHDCANLPEPGLLYELNTGGISATKRRRQIVSTLRLQMRYFRPFNPWDWLGLAKNLLHLATPYRALHGLKRRLFARREAAGTPLRIALACNTAWAIYTYRQGLLRTLAAAGVELTVIAPRDRTFEPLTALGCRCIELPVASRGTRPVEDLRTLWALYRHYRALRPHVVFHYTIKPNIYGSIAARLADVDSVAVTTGLGYVFIQPSRAARVAKRLYRFAFRFPREVWFLNRDDEAAFRAENLLAHPERARLLHGEGVDLAAFAFMPLPAGKDRFDFLLIGRLLWDKGVGEYAEAARRLRARYPRARFQLLGPVGVANPSALTREEVAAWEREGIIEYLGETQDVRPAIAAADCVVLPSYREGVPRTLMEAAAMGRPIVATDVPGCREVVIDGENGLLCTARDAASLADRLAQMLDMSEADRRVMGERGRRLVEREFDERDVIERYKTIIKTLTGVSL